MLKPNASSGSAPPSPGELWAVPKVDMEAEKRAQFAAEDEMKRQAMLQDEAHKASFGDDARAKEAAQFAARQAEERAALASKSASETAFATRQQMDAAQANIKHNEAVMAVDTNRNGKSDYVEAQEAERARAIQAAATVVAAVAVTAAFSDANAPRGGYSAFDSAALTTASPITMAAAAPPAVGAAPSNNPVMNPANPIVVGASLATAAVAAPVVSEVAPVAMAPLSAVVGAFAMTSASRGAASMFDSRPAAPTPEPVMMAEAPVAPVVARSHTPSVGLSFKPPAPSFKQKKSEA